MNKYLTTLGLASALIATSCSNDDVLPKSDSEKSAIEFSMTDNNTVKSVSGQSRAGFSKTTGIVMRMAATNAADAAQTKYTRTEATAETGTNYSTLSFSDGGTNTRYWDDAYGRNTLLSIYAVAVPDKTGVIAASALKGDNTWSDNSDNTLSWSVGTTQTSDVISNEDLVYSNNIQPTFTEYNQKNGVYKYDFATSSYPAFDGTDFSTLIDGQMQFRLKQATVTDGPGKFDKGNLNFVHALSRITLNVVLGEGFTGTNTISNVKMFGMPQTGTFDVQQGLFTTTTTNDINMATLADKKYIGQVLPGYVFATGTETNVLQFEVAGNLYYVTQGSIYTALNTTANQSKLKYTDGNNGIVMQQGQNYILTVTVNKTKIDKITATLADWTELTGEFERNNAYLSFSFSDYGGDASSNFSLYRSASAYTDYVVGEPYEKHYDWETNYAGNIASLTAPAAGSNVWQTNWLWDDNKTFYHLRMVGTDGTNERTISTENGKDYFDIAAGATNGNYRWGAPMINGKTLGYDLTNGFDYSATDHHISHAIGATNDVLHFTEVNMLSHIKVIVKTTTGDNKVTLYDATKGMTKVSLTHIYKNGRVYMGNGLVAATGSRSATATEMTAPDASKASAYAIDGSFDYYVVPQALVDNDTYVGLTIETPDKNIYYVVEKLSTILASTVTNAQNVAIGQSKGQAITYWYPNCCYTYTVTLSKAGIDKFTATLAPYTEITGENTDITIED